MTATLGYTRVSTTGQALDSQLAALATACIDSERVSTDKRSGSAKTDRPGLAAMLASARTGNTAVDRLGRPVAEVTHTIAELGDRRILLRAPCVKLSIQHIAGRAISAIMTTLAELELELGRERSATSCNSRLTHH